MAPTTTTTTEAPLNTKHQVVLLIDNYDSFTYNLYQYLMMARASLTVLVKRNDAITIDDITILHPDLIVLSPGPGYPSTAGICNAIIRTFGGDIPIAGVCLGMQCMVEVYGGTVGPAGEIRHGKTSEMVNDQKGIFNGLPSSFKATRYHSLVGLQATLPECLEVSCTCNKGEMMMALRHKTFRVEGVQFHPESILTEHGKAMVANFLTL